jgi:hypothetical protein
MIVTKPKRIETAIEIRNHALTILRRHGRYEPMARGPAMPMWRGGPFAIMYRTPDTAAKLLAAHLSTGLGEALPYGIDIWHGKKVFSLEWADDGQARIINFKRGPWESELFALSPE